MPLVLVYAQMVEPQTPLKTHPVLERAAKATASGLLRYLAEVMTDASARSDVWSLGGEAGEEDLGVAAVDGCALVVVEGVGVELPGEALRRRTASWSNR